MDVAKRLKNFGIGTDIESIDRFRKLDRVKDNSFLHKIFTKSELEYCFSRGVAAPHLAARYAGKEAIVKALNSMGKTNLDYKEIEIFNDENEAPRVRINNTDFHDLQVYVSLSHCKDKALAFAIVMGADRHEED